MDKNIDKIISDDEMKKDLKTTFEFLKLIIRESHLQSLINTPQDDLCVYYFTLGLWLRNSILSPDTKLYRHFIDSGLKNKDDMSTYIVYEFYKYLKVKWD